MKGWTVLYPQKYKDIRYGSSVIQANISRNSVQPLQGIAQKGNWADINFVGVVFLVA